MSDNERAGHCYFWALEYVIDHHADLVHGYPTLTDGPHKGMQYGHAWAERDGWVFDVVARALIPKALYYVAGKINPDECRAYSLDDAIVMLVEFEHYGPWEDVVPDATFASEDD